MTYLKMKMMKHNPYLIDDIAYGIGNICIKYGRIPVLQTKEKYGTVRVYNSWGIGSLHALIWPNYVYKHPSYPKWLWNLDIQYLSRFFNLLDPIIIRWQHFIYNFAYWKYIKKYPQLFDEITGCADWKEELGFHLPTLCSAHSADYKKSCYLNSDKCDFCKEGVWFQEGNSILE